MLGKNLIIWLTNSKNRWYPIYPEKPETKIDTQKYASAYFNTPTQTQYLECFQYPTRPNTEKPYPLGTALSPFFYFVSQEHSLKGLGSYASNWNNQLHGLLCKIQLKIEILFKKSPLNTFNN